MIELLNLPLLGGLAVAAAPVVIHIAHRRKVKPIQWAAMRFLIAMPASSRRRLFIENWLLLLVRIGVLFLAALALTRPALRSSWSSLHDGAVVRQGRTAAILLIDDSASSAAGRGRSSIDEMKELANAYLDSLVPGDEVSIIRLSQLGAPVADPLFDLEAARKLIAGLQPTAVASDVSALLHAGLAQASRHLNPGVEIVLLQDGRSEGWKPDDKARWDSLQRRLRGAPSDSVGTRQRPRVVLLSPPAKKVEGNLAVSSIRLDRALIPIHRPVSIIVALQHSGVRAASGMLLRLSVDGRTVEERTLNVPAGGKKDIVFSHSFDEAGSHVLEAVVEGARDALAIDDRRSLAIEVTGRLPALLVEGDSRNGLAGSLGFVSAALDPDDSGAGLFQVTRCSVGRFSTIDLTRYRVVVLGDIPALDADAIAKIERFLVTGGGILVGLGDNTDVDLANRFWARGGDGFLPCPLNSEKTPTPAPVPGAMTIGHPALGAFSTQAAELWKGSSIRRYFSLDPKTLGGGDLVKLVTMDNNDPLVVERGRGRGRVILVASSLSASDNDLPFHPAYVPLIRGLVGYLGSVVLPPRNLAPGERITFSPHSEAIDPATVVGENPVGEPFPLTPGRWEHQTALISDPLLQSGGYRVRDSAGRHVIYYAVGLSHEESQLQPLPDSDIDKALAGVGPRWLRDPKAVTATLGPSERQSLEIWRWLILSAVGLLFLETWMVRRQSSNESKRSEAVFAGVGHEQPARAHEPSPSREGELVGGAAG